MIRISKLTLIQPGDLLDLGLPVKPKRPAADFQRPVEWGGRISGQAVTPAGKAEASRHVQPETSPPAGTYPLTFIPPGR